VLAGDLGFRGQMSVGQNQDVAVGLGQRFQRDANVEGIDQRIDQRIGPILAARRFDVRQWLSRVATPRAPMISCHVVGDAEQPRRHATSSRIVILGCAPGADQRFAHELLRIGGIAEPPQTQRIERPREAVVERVEGIGFSSPDLGQQAGVILVGHGRSVMYSQACIRTLSVNSSSGRSELSRSTVPSCRTDAPPLFFSPGEPFGIFARILAVDPSRPNQK